MCPAQSIKGLCAVFTAGFRLVKPVLVCYSAVQKFRKEKNHLQMDAALRTPESEEGDVATKGKSTIFETFLNSDPLMRLQNNPNDVDYAITKGYNQWWHPEIIYWQRRPRDQQKFDGRSAKRTSAKLEVHRSYVNDDLHKLFSKAKNHSEFPLRV